MKLWKNTISEIKQNEKTINNRFKSALTLSLKISKWKISY